MWSYSQVWHTLLKLALSNRSSNQFQKHSGGQWLRWPQWATGIWGTVIIQILTHLCSFTSYRCGAFLECRLLRRSRLRELFLQVHSGRLLVGSCYDDYRGLWWHDVWCTHFTSSFSCHFIYTQYICFFFVLFFVL